MAFTLTNGESYDITDTNRLAKKLKPEHHGKFLPVLIKKEYADGTIHGSSELDSSLKDNPVTTMTKQVINTKTDKVQDVVFTCLLAKNEDYVEYPTVDTYIELGFASNCEYEHKIEIVFKSEEMTQRLFTNWTGAYSFMDTLNNLEDELIEEIQDGNVIDQGFSYNDDSDTYIIIMYNDEGELIDIELNQNELFNSVMSVRVIDI